MNYYKVLEVDREASPEVIAKAYRALSMKHHPDRKPPEERAVGAERMRRINEAYAVLSDGRRRRAYDRHWRWWRIWLGDGMIGLAKEWLEER